ncbi:Sodium/hydrogen exchanger 2 [Halotydeus destructor]|nr:Sodium/hydrogen exchanger 2 [Halotydeus destructor]
MSSRSFLCACVFLTLVVVLIAETVPRKRLVYPTLHVDDEPEESPIHLWSWRWAEVSKYVVTSVFILIAALIKLLYHNSPVHEYVPESCVLIIIGTLFQLTLSLFGNEYADILPAFDHNLFFYLLLPPIILESAYSLYDRVFFNNLGTILLYAIFGTIINVTIVSLGIQVLEHFGAFGVDISFTETLTFSTLICAVDPVAVLAIFHELGVNKYLYFLVFGESLLNDAVVITMYNSVTIMATMNVLRAQDVLLGMLNFVTVSGGGLIIGIFFGSSTAIITRYTITVRVVEPIIVIVTAYLSYVIAELFHFSGIIGLIACGIMQMEYSKHNISARSFTTIKYFTKNLSSICDVIIFFYLGKVLVRDDHEWNIAFILSVTSLCVLVRFCSVFGLTSVANHVMKRVRKINLEEQLVMAYGGLRGAIAFSLAITLDKEMKNRDLFVTTTLVVILFTVFILGSTTKPLVKLLRVKSEQKDTPKMFGFINDKTLETVMAGVESVAGQRKTHYWHQKLSQFNQNHLKPFLCRRGQSYNDYNHMYNMVRNEKPHSLYIGRPKLSATISTDDTVPQLKSHISDENEALVDRQTSVRFENDEIKISLDPTPLANPGSESSAAWLERIKRNKTRTMPSAPRGRQLRRFHSQFGRDREDDARRTFNTALSRTSYYQIPGSIHSIDNSPPVATRARTYMDYRFRANSDRKQDEV